MVKDVSIFCLIQLMFAFILLVLIDFQPHCIDGSLLMILLCWCGLLHQMISMPSQHCGEKLKLRGIAVHYNALLHCTEM